MMNIVRGRDNLSVTVHVPVDCTNNCKFCTSKKLYKDGVNFTKVKDQLKLVRNSTIKEVVFTGGEPTENMMVLRDLIDIVDNKDVYINTSLPEKNAHEFIEYINDKGCVKGVNISRHCASLEEDGKILNNIAHDIYLKFIKKPVKINVVLNESNIDVEKVIAILDRWYSVDTGKNKITVSFRADYRKMDIQSLFDTTGSIDTNLIDFFNIGEYLDRTYCSVCHTMKFQYANIKFSYHRGLEFTSKKIGNTLEVNDIIISPQGEMYYDWDQSNTYMEEVKKYFGMDEVIVARPRPSLYDNLYTGCGTVSPSRSYSGCGFSRGC